MWDFLIYKNNNAIIDENGTKVTYGEMSEIGNELANKMRKRSLVISFCQNSIGSIIGYVSFINNGTVPILFNENLQHDLKIGLLHKYLPEYIWAPINMISEFQEFEEIYRVYDYVLLKTAYEVQYPLNSQLALLLSTSGSTGSPKLVRQSYLNIKANTNSIVKYLKLNENEKAITTLPMNYTYGLSIINTHFWVGATILVTKNSFLEKGFWDFLKKEKATSFGGVPYTYELLKKIGYMSMDLPTIKTMTQAGGKMHPELHREFACFSEEKHKKFIVMYGQCEATARMSYLPMDKSLHKCGSIGIPIPGGRFMLVDDQNNKIKQPYITGELVYEGENVTLGYAENGEDLIKGDERKGILYTGDMAQFDEEGYYYIVGRKKRFLKIFGNRINLDEIEQMIKTEFSGIESACTGVDDRLYVFITSENLTTMKEIKIFLSRKTGFTPIAFEVKAISHIPQNEAGKTLYCDLEKFCAR